MYKVWFTVLIALYSTASFAQQVSGARHGAIPFRVDSVGVASGLTVTYQYADDSRVKDELQASVDIVSTIPTQSGQWTIYVDGNTTPRVGGVFDLVPDANADAGHALDRDGKGRLQVSDLHHIWFLGNQALVAGLLDPTTPLDSSDVAGDETRQFLGNPFFRNPTIAFPDHTLGAVFLFKPGQRSFDYTLVLSSSHGLADNPNRSYSELFDVTETGKGVFAATEVVHQTGRDHWRAGLWVQTADNAYLDGSGNTGNNYGLYANADLQLGLHRLNVRLGWANDKVSEAATFASIAVEHPLGRNVAGIGIAHTGVSDNAVPGKDDATHAELYVRLELQDGLQISPSIQWIRNSGFDSTGTTVDNSLGVYSVRATYLF